MHETLLEKSRARLISCGVLSFAPETSYTPGDLFLYSESAPRWVIGLDGIRYGF